MAQQGQSSDSLTARRPDWLPHLTALLITGTSIAVITVLWRKIGALPNPEVLLLLTVAVTTYLAGGMAGMLSAAIVLVSSFVLFSSPADLFRYDEMDWRQAMLIVVASPLIALMVGSLKEQVDRLREVTLENDRLHGDLERYRRMAIQLQVCEERFRVTTECIPGHGIVVLDDEGTVKSWNSAAEALTGYNAKDIVGQSWSRLFTKEDIVARKPTLLLEKAQFLGSVEDDGWQLTKSESQVHTSTVISAIKTGSRPAAGFVMVVRKK